MTAPQPLIDRYLDDEATADDLATLEAWLLADPANAQELARQAAFHDQLLNWWRVRSSIESVQGAANWPLGEGPVAKAAPPSTPVPVGPRPAVDLFPRGQAPVHHGGLSQAPTGALDREDGEQGTNAASALAPRPAQAQAASQPGSSQPGSNQLPDPVAAPRARRWGDWGRLVHWSRLSPWSRSGHWRQSGQWRRWSVAAALLGAMALIWAFQSQRGASELQAGTVALEQLIESQAGRPQRVFRLTVENSEPLSRARSAEEERRPRKPTLEGALLSMGPEGRFVFERRTERGEPFVTGSNGVHSWAVRPWGPVLISRDPARFRRDLPGQDLGFPLVEIDTVLTQLKTAYTIRLQAEVSPGCQRLIAVKNRRVAGPRVVEVTYDIARREIRSLRFTDLAYGANRLTLRLDESPVSRTDSFFEHASHHLPTRRVEYE